MQNDKQPEERPVIYIRLLSYPNACKVIDFIKANDSDDYAHITPGGVSTQVFPANWNKVIDYMESLNARYELTTEHPEKVTSKIVQNLIAKDVIKVAVGGYTDEQAKEVIRRRHQIVLDYCKTKGWDADTAKLSIQQVMEIRGQQSWKDVPQKVKEEFKTV